MSIYHPGKRVISGLVKSKSTHPVGR